MDVDAIRAMRTRGYTWKAIGEAVARSEGRAEPYAASYMHRMAEDKSTPSHLGEIRRLREQGYTDDYIGDKLGRAVDKRPYTADEVRRMVPRPRRDHGKMGEPEEL